MNIDRKDKALLELLAKNCRLSNAAIARAIGLTKEAVSYRIARLQEEEWLKEWVLFVDARRLGFTRYHLLLRLEEKKIDKEALYKKLSSHDAVMWVNSFIGRYDIQVIVDAVDSFHLNKIKEEIFRTVGSALKEYTILTHLHDLEFTQLNPVLEMGTKVGQEDDSSFSGLLFSRNFPVDITFERVETDGVDAEILQELSHDPRCSLSEIGRRTHLDRQTVKKRIERLIRKGVILNFGGIPNLSKLRFVTYYLLVRIAQDTDERALRKPFRELRNIFYAGRMVGDSDLILYLNARTPDELYQSVELFRRDMGHHILHYDLLVQERVHHWKQFTGGIYRALRERNKEGNSMRYIR